MSRIHHATLISSEIPFDSDKITLPGADPADTGVSEKQLAVIRQFLQTEPATFVDPNGDPNQTIADAHPRWAAALPLLRVKFRVTRDYQIIQHIHAIWDERRAPKAVSVRQHNYAMDMLSWVSDPESAPNERVRAALRDLDPAVRARLKLDAVMIDTQGDFAKFRQKFYALVPRTEQSAPLLDTMDQTVPVSEDEELEVDLPDERF